MTKKIIIFVLVGLTILIQSCGVFSAKDVYDEVSKHIEIKMKTGAEKPVDSLAINFEPVYFKLGKCNIVKEKEYDIIKNGYKIWILETADTFRIEVIRVDTMGYIYKR